MISPHRTTAGGVESLRRVRSLQGRKGTSVREQSNPEPLHGRSNIELSLEVAQVHDDLEDIFARLDAGRLISRQAGADLLEQLQSISDHLFNREQ